MKERGVLTVALTGLLGVKGETMIVDINEIERCLRYFKAINDANLDDIVWVRGGEILQATPEQIEEYKFIGLSNRDFPSVAGWMPEDIGIRVATMVLTKTHNGESNRAPRGAGGGSLKAGVRRSG